MSVEQTETTNLGKGELKARQQDSLNLLLSTHSQSYGGLLADATSQLARLDTHKLGKTKSPSEQIEMVMLSLETSDTKVAADYESTRSALRRYRDDVAAALQFAALRQNLSPTSAELTPGAQESYDLLVRLQKESDAVTKKLQNPWVTWHLADFPHVLDLLRSYEELTAVTPLLDEVGVPYTKPKTVNNLVRSFLFPADKSSVPYAREGDNVLGISLLARKVVLAKWLKERADYHGDSANSRISLMAASLFRKIQRTHPSYDHVQAARHFCELAMRREHQEQLKKIENYREFRGLFPLKSGAPQDMKFEHVDLAAAYSSYAQYLAVPDAFIDLAKDVVNGEKYRAIGRELAGPHYAEDTYRRWVESMVLFLERGLVGGKRLGAPTHYLPVNQLEKLREVKKLFYST